MSTDAATPSASTVTLSRSQGRDPVDVEGELVTQWVRTYQVSDDGTIAAAGRR